MANSFQKVLFALSSSSPIIIVFAVVWYLKNHDLKGSLIIGIIGILLTDYVLLFIHICNKHVEPISISIAEVTSNDIWVLGYIISYITPLFSLAIDEISPIAICIVILVFSVVLATSNTVFPNPILRVLGYHFYKVSTVDGAKDYCFICRRKEIHNTDIIKKARYAFGYFLIDKE